MEADSCPGCSVTSLGLGGRGAHLVVPSMIAPALACVLVANRVFWRLRMVGGLGPDDFSTILALIFLIVQCGASIAAVNFGYGRAFDTLNQYQASEALKYFFLLQIFYKLTINCTKLSILLLYLRIFTDRRWFIRTCWGLISCVLVSCISFTVATIFQCCPVRGAWERWITSPKCLNIYALWYSNAIYNILTDFIIVLMVPPVIFKLRLPPRQKLALTGIFGLGVIVCTASISRLTTLYSSAYGGDATAGSLISSIWTTIEAGLGVICANLPMLRTPLQHLLPKLFPSRPSTYQASSTNLPRPSGLSNSTTLSSTTRLTQTACSTGDKSVSSPTWGVSIPATRPTSTLREEVFQLPNTTYLANCVRLETQVQHNDSFTTRGTIDPSADMDWYHGQYRVW